MFVGCEITVVGGVVGGGVGGHLSLGGGDRDVSRRGHHRTVQIPGRDDRPETAPQSHDQTSSGGVSSNANPRQKKTHLSLGLGCAGGSVTVIRRLGVLLVVTEEPLQKSRQLQGLCRHPPRLSTCRTSSLTSGFQCCYYPPTFWLFLFLHPPEKKREAVTDRSHTVMTPLSSF